jgi:hypothetical protein
MHHGPNPFPGLDAGNPSVPDEVAQALGATGNYPDGKLNDDDEGEIAFAVGHTEAGKVVLDFGGTKVAWMATTPQQARQLARVLRKHADAVDRDQRGRSKRPRAGR